MDIRFSMLTPHTSHREWFATYDRSDGGTVSLGGDYPSKLAGVGTIRVRMYDGIIRILSNVKHVLKLKKIDFFGLLGVVGICF